MRRIACLTLALTTVALVGCGGEPRPTPTDVAPPARTQPPATASATLLVTSGPTDTGTAAQSPPSAPPATSSADGSPATTPASPLDLGSLTVTLEPFVTGLDALTFVTHAGDGSGVLYAVEQRGVVRAISVDGTAAEAPFLDIRDRVRAGGEQGLLGLAFHPDFETNGRLFADYTDPNGDTVIAEFRATGGVADAASERRLLSIEQPYANHNGGMIEFGPDGYLYIATGDGGGAGDPLGAGQDVNTLLGKILRIDVDDADPYGIPPDNPFADDPAARPEIWAYGLRNPWRFSFDRQTDGLFIGDVGQGTWEEINAEPAGAGGRNYGWNVMEGPDCFAAPDCDAGGLTMPVAWYSLADGNCAVTGGYVYRGQQHPSLNGAYLFADYCAGTIWGLNAAAALETGAATSVEIGASGINPASFGEDESGELYVAGHGGEILRVVASER